MYIYICRYIDWARSACGPPPETPRMGTRLSSARPRLTGDTPPPLRSESWPPEVARSPLHLSPSHPSPLSPSHPLTIPFSHPLTLSPSHPLLLSPSPTLPHSVLSV